MTYQDICSRNRFLYEELEKITRLLQFASDLGLDLDATHLLSRKITLKQKIEDNLDALESYWSTAGNGKRIKRTVLGPEYTKQRDQIITLYKRNPNLSMSRIAFELELSISLVNRFVSEFLGKGV